MKRHASARKMRACFLEQLESRRLLAWGEIPDAIDLDLARQNYPTIDGRGSAIVNLDAGINQDHTGFTDRLWTGTVDDFLGNGNMTAVHGWNYYSGPVGGDGFIIGDSNIEEIFPTEGGHGTQDASVAVNNNFTYSGDGDEYEGIASGAEVISLKIAHIGGDGSGSNLNDTESGGVKRALQWVINHREEFNIVAVNMSFGVLQATYTHATFGFQSEIQQLANAGVVLAAAAANDGVNGTMLYPAADSNVITVGGWNAANNTVTSSAEIRATSTFSRRV